MAREEGLLGMTDPANTGQDYCPATEISDGKGGYIGAFRNSLDNWMSGWTNFDPRTPCTENIKLSTKI